MFETIKALIQGELFDNFDGRVEDLHWREDDDGNLYVGQSRRPETLKQVSLDDDGGLSVSEADPHEADWERLTVVSEPDTVTTRQQD